MSEGPLRMVGYGRVSTDEEKQLDSLEHQILFFSQFARSRGYELVRVYADEGISGKQLKKRDEFLRMLREAEEDIYDVVVVKDVSRFARNTVDLLTSVRRLREIGVNVLFVNNNQETLGESEFIITLLGAMAQEESANLSKRVKFGKDITARRGRVPREILGYDKVDNFTLKIHPEEADLVRRIYRMYLCGGYGMARIAAALQSEGLCTKKGCAYSEGYVRRVLTNPIYCGLLVNHKTETVDFINGTQRPVPEEERYRHHRPELAIVSREEFEAVQDLRAQRRRAQTQTGPEPRRRYSGRYLLSGLVRCAQCGRTMVRQNQRRSNGVGEGYWRCPAGTGMRPGETCANPVYVRDDVLEQAVSGALSACAGDEAAFAREVEQCRAQWKAGGDGGQVRQRQTVERLEKQRRKYVELCARELLSVEELEAHTQKIDGQLQRLRQEQEKQAEPWDSVAAVKAFFSLRSAENQDLRRLVSHILVAADKTARIIFRVDGDALQ